MSASAQTSGVQSERQSRVGKVPIPIPKGVSINLSGRRIEVQGPKGKLARDLPDQTEIARDGDIISIRATATGRDGPRLQGLARALVASMVQGAAEGFTKILELVGTGYRGEVQGSTITMQVGLSHPAVCVLPEGVSVEIPKESKGSVLVLTSADKEVLGRVAASIRAMRPPEPYGGKGIRFRGEKLRRKAGKAGKKAS